MAVRIEHEVFEKIIEQKEITFEEMSALDGFSYEKAFNVMQFLIQKKVLKECIDGRFIVSVDQRKITEIRHEAGDWKIDFSEKKLKSLGNHISSRTLVIVDLIEKQAGLSEEEIINKFGGGISKIISQLIHSGLLVRKDGNLFSTITAADLTKLKKYAEKKLFSEEEDEKNQEDDDRWSEEEGLVEDEGCLENEEENEEFDKTVFEFDDNMEFISDENNSVPSFPLGLSAITLQINLKNNPDINSIDAFVRANETGIGLNAKINLTDTPREVVHKIIEQNSKEDVARAFNHRSDLDAIISDVGIIDMRSDFSLVLGEKEIAISRWDSPIAEQAIVKIEGILEFHISIVTSNE